MLPKSFVVSRSFHLPIDLHKEKASRKSKAIRLQGSSIGTEASVILDFNIWLPKAAEVYNISRDIRDYIIIPVVANVSDIPNTNGDSFSTREWTAFNPDQGCLAFQSFKGKPTFVEHNNQDYTKARGVIADSHLGKLSGFRTQHSKLTLLLTFDRNLEPDRCNRMLSGELNTFSKGTMYKAYRCSICGQIVTPKRKNFCAHTDFRRLAYLDPISGRLAYRECIGLTGFECSSVDDPAFACAASYPEHLMRVI